MRPVGWPPTARGVGRGRTPLRTRASLVGRSPGPCLPRSGSGDSIPMRPGSASAQIPPTRVRNQVLAWRGASRPNSRAGKRPRGVGRAGPLGREKWLGAGGCQSFGNFST